MTTVRVRHQGDGLMHPGLPFDQPSGKIVGRFPPGRLSLHLQPDQSWHVIEAPATADARTGPLTPAEINAANRRHYGQ